MNLLNLLSTIAKTANAYREAHGRSPARIKVGPEFLDALEEECYRRPDLALLGREVKFSGERFDEFEWRQAFRRKVNNGELKIFGMRVQVVQP